MAQPLLPLSLAWWTGDAAPALLEDWDGARAIGVAGQVDRDAARQAIRAALHAVLAAWSALAPDAIELHAEPGRAQPPYALLNRGGRLERIGLAISHDEELSVAAFNPQGAVGIDVMRVVDAPDWRQVSRDYLGPATTDALAALPALARPAAFARAWSAHEARLKCVGLGLVEWDADLERRLAPCRCRPLQLPNGYVGYVALPEFG